MTDLVTAPADTLAPIHPQGPAVTAFSNPFLTVQTTPVAFPNGTEGHYSTVTLGTGSGVIIVPTTVGVNGWAGTSYGFVNAYRFPVAQTLLELPRGGCEPGETTEAAAAREIVEEMGPEWEQAHLARLGVLYPDTGLLTTEMTVYAAHLDQPPATDHVEGLTGAGQVWIPLSTLPASIATRRITDGMTLAALMLACFRR